MKRTENRSLIIETQGGLMRMMLVNNEADVMPRTPPDTKRSAVTEFSAASRRRFGRILATIEPTQSMHFMTLTFPNDYPDVQTCKRHLRNFMKRLQRQQPELIMIWKMEFQERGAPHFHLLLLNWRYWDQKELLDLWCAVTKMDVTHLDIRATKGDKAKAAKYISKYMRKASSFTNDAYHSKYPSSTLGRFWGVWGKAEIKFAKSEFVQMRFEWHIAQRLFDILVKMHDMQKQIDREYHPEYSVTYYTLDTTASEIFTDIGNAMLEVDPLTYPEDHVQNYITDESGATSIAFQQGAWLSYAQRILAGNRSLEAGTTFDTILSEIPF